MADTVESRLERIESKLDAHLEMATRNATAIDWMRWIIGGAWIAIAGLFATK